MDGRLYTVAGYRDRMRHGDYGGNFCPPYLGLMGPRPTQPLDETTEDGEPIWWLSHLRCMIRDSSDD